MQWMQARVRFGRRGFCWIDFMRSMDGLYKKINFMNWILRLAFCWFCLLEFGASVQAMKHA